MTEHDARRFLKAAQSSLEGSQKGADSVRDLALVSIAASLVDLSASLRAENEAIALAKREHPTNPAASKLRAIRAGQHPEPLWLDEG